MNQVERDIALAMRRSEAVAEVIFETVASVLKRTNDQRMAAIAAHLIAKRVLMPPDEARKYPAFAKVMGGEDRAAIRATLGALIDETEMTVEAVRWAAGPAMDLAEKVARAALRLRDYQTDLDKE